MGNLDEWRIEKADYDNIIAQLAKHLKQWESMKVELNVNKEHDYRFHGKLWEQNQLARIQYEMEQIESLRVRLKKYDGNQRVRQSRVGIWDNPNQSNKAFGSIWDR